MENKTKEEIGQGTAMTKEDFAALWKTIRLKVTDTYEVPPEILWVNGSTIGTLGNFSASTGKAKSKKTFNISAIVAAALKNDEVLKYSAYLPPNKRKILYVDTEQSKYHCHKVMERILRLAGLPTDKDVDDFVFIVLREQTPDKRKQIIGYMLENMPDVGLLIIDGIRDLMYDNECILTENPNDPYVQKEAFLNKIAHRGSDGTERYLLQKFSIFSDENE